MTMKDSKDVIKNSLNRVKVKWRTTHLNLFGSNYETIFENT